MEVKWTMQRRCTMCSLSLILRVCNIYENALGLSLEDRDIFLAIIMQSSLLLGAYDMTIILIGAYYELCVWLC